MSSSFGLVPQTLTTVLYLNYLNLPNISPVLVPVIQGKKILGPKSNRKFGETDPIVTQLITKWRNQ